MDYYRAVGYFADTPPVYGDLGEIAAGLKPGRERPEERIACMNLGLALEDMVTAKLIFDRAVQMGVGARLEL